MDDEIRLSSNEFKALASDTRTSIIKLLKLRNHTLTEISKKLKLAAPTIKQHLGILEDAQLIQELDEGRKWKYYMLTRKGKNIFSNETPVNVLIVLGVSVFALAGLMFSFISMVGEQAVLFTTAQVVKGNVFIGTGDNLALPAATAGEKIAEEASRQVVYNYIGQTAGNFAAFPIMTLGIAIAIVAFIAGFFIARALK